MLFDIEVIEETYRTFNQRVKRAATTLGRAMTLTEKILYAHADGCMTAHKRGEDYVNFRVDRVAMQDATAQMALLQFMTAGKNKVAVPSSVHCDHLIVAENGAKGDLAAALRENSEVYGFLKDVSNKYGIGFWEPGAGIIHQIILENYAFPGGLMVGTDSHTPNAGGLGMLAIGVGGADAVDAMVGDAWELKMPRIIGVNLTGKLNGWASAKDVILKLAGMLTVKGATNAVIEYFGPGAASLSATDKATICNMGAEVGATTSVFAYDDHTKAYLCATGREKVAAQADRIKECLQADPEVEQTPGNYFDRVIDIDLSAVEPCVNGPFTPDLATPVSQLAEAVRKNNYPDNMEVGLIGSCTNSSYESLSRAASVARQAADNGLSAKAELIVNPGSNLVMDTARRDGILQSFEAIGGVIMSNACGPCIGQWKRHNNHPQQPNSIVTSFNRNFAKRNDGNPNTYAFVASPEIVTALTIAGSLSFNPLTDTLINSKGQPVKLNPPTGSMLPAEGFMNRDAGYIPPLSDGSGIEIRIDRNSQRLQRLQPFNPFDKADFTEMPLLIKTEGKCTTDHISMAGPWLKFRGHLENISDNLLMGAVNAFNGKTDSVLDPSTGSYEKVSALAKRYKSQSLSSVVVAEENYGEGSSREHAALEPRFLNVKMVLCKSFARIHETNLKKQGMLAVTFADMADYGKIRENDRFSVPGIENIVPGKPLEVELLHGDGTKESISVLHTYNELQINWFKAGSALNHLASARKNG